MSSSVISGNIIISLFLENNYIALILVLITSLSCLITYFLIKARNIVGIIDTPNHRSLHDTPKPRTGGLAVLIAIVAGLFLLQQYIDNRILSILPYTLLIICVSFIDDIVPISALLRLLLQILLATVFVLNGLALESLVLPGLEISLAPLIGIPITIFFVVWIINLYNFMDGMDGFSGGMAVFGFGTFAILAFMKGDIGFALINLIIVAATLGFLAFNLPPSRIFLGDVGSTLLGMFVALFLLWADSNKIFPIWIGVIVFLPFILDSTVTLGKRVLLGEKFWHPHCTHYYQRLVLSGLGHKKTLVFEYSWMMICSIVSIVLFRTDNFTMQMSLLILFTVLCIALLLYIDKLTFKSALKI